MSISWKTDFPQPIEQSIICYTRNSNWSGTNPNSTVHRRRQRWQHPSIEWKYPFHRHQITKWKCKNDCKSTFSCCVALTSKRWWGWDAECWTLKRMRERERETRMENVHKHKQTIVALNDIFIFVSICLRIFPTYSRHLSGANSSAKICISFYVSTLEFKTTTTAAAAGGSQQPAAVVNSLICNDINGEERAYTISKWILLGKSTHQLENWFENHRRDNYNLVKDI